MSHLHTPEVKAKAAMRRRHSKQESREARQKLFLKEYRKAACNVTAACEKIGITRKTFYEWQKSSKNFAEEIQHIEESFIDYAETKLKSQISDGNLTAIIFFLKCKAKARGYVDRVETFVGGVPGHPVQVQGEVAITLDELKEEISPAQIKEIAARTRRGEHLRFREENHDGVKDLRTRQRKRLVE